MPAHLWIPLLAAMGLTALATLAAAFAASRRWSMVRDEGRPLRLTLRPFENDRRKMRIREQLPDALDHLARSLQAGLGFHEALRLCGEEMPAPVGAEFARLSDEIRLGRDTRAVFEQWMNRSPEAFEQRLFASGVLLQRDTGGNLIEILDNLATTLRSRALFHARVRALTSEARFSAWILGGLPIAVFAVLVVVHPGYLAPLFRDPLGHLFIAYFLLSYAVGLLLMRRVARVAAA